MKYYEMTRNGCELHAGGENIPPGGWRGGEEIPPGGWRGGEEIPPGGWRSILDTYRTEDGYGYFAFLFVDVGPHYEIDIISMPSYGNRSADLHDTHRLPSDRGGHSICFGDNSVAVTMSKARKWAASWAELTWDYIKYGKAFPNA